MPSRLAELSTPVVLVDLATMERNVAAMAEHARRLGVSLRPHAKTHKSVEIARRQLAAGAGGLTVATVGEAEVFAGAGVDDLFVAYPLWADQARGRRVAALCERVRLRVGIDSADGAVALGRAVPAGRVEVVVEVDSGQHRTGVPPADAAPVADAAARAGLVVVGVFTFPGHGYGPGRAEQAAGDEADALMRASEALRAAGHEVTVRSGGSTPTAAHTHVAPVTEVRPGVYVFNDDQQLVLGTCSEEDVALTVLATVTSAPAAGHFVVDAGSKVLGADRPPWVPGHGRVLGMPGARIESVAEHHGVCSLPPDAPMPEVGRRVRIVPNHVCTTVNLMDELVVTAGDDVVDVWPVDARGRNS